MRSGQCPLLTFSLCNMWLYTVRVKCACVCVCLKCNMWLCTIDRRVKQLRGNKSVSQSHCRWIKKQATKLTTDQWGDHLPLTSDILSAQECCSCPSSSSSSSYPPTLHQDKYKYKSKTNTKQIQRQRIKTADLVQWHPFSSGMLLILSYPSYLPPPSPKVNDPHKYKNERQIRRKYKQ